MKKLHPTTQYKKDYKRFRNNPNKLKKLMTVLNMLQSEKKSRRNIILTCLLGIMQVIWNATSREIFC